MFYFCVLMCADIFSLEIMWVFAQEQAFKTCDFFFFKGEELVRADSELEDSEDSEPEEVEEFNLSKVEAKPVDPPSKTPTGPPLASGNKSNRQLTTRIEEVLIL